METYWNNNGKYQEWVDKTNAIMPDMYDTDNYYMNVFIAFSNIYYDIYNNGGGIPTSKQQKYICDLYSGKLNYPIGKFFIDIFFDNFTLFSLVAFLNTSPPI